MDLLEGLNPAQAEAAKITEGPLLILAGAGSGKTKTLTHHMAYLIKNEGIESDHILALTFTNKAAREMRIRLGKILGQDGSKRGFMPWMGTFHGICVRLLKIDGDKVGVAPNFVIYDDDDRLRLVKQALRQLNIGEKELKPKMIVSIISNSKNQMVSAEDFADSADFPKQKSIAKVYSLYEKMRSAANALDFDDLLLETLKLFKTNKEVRKKWQQKFQHILIDEYQDTNSVQYNIVKLLVNEKRNICVVGDDWQSIYSWRGADFTNILNFERDFEGAKVVKLEQNYRSTNNILEAASKVIAKNTQRTDKKIWTAVEGGEPVQIHGLRDDMEEANFAAQTISAQVSSGERDYGDFAILYRTNAQSYTFERAFIRYRMPYQIVGGTRFYDRREVKDIIAYLKLLYQPCDRVSFSRIVNIPARGIGAVSLQRFLQWQESSDRDIIATLCIADQIEGLTSRAKEMMMKLGEKLSSLSSNLDKISPANLIESIIDFTEYRAYVNDGTPQAEDRLANLDSLLADAQNFVVLSDFLEEVALMSSTDAEGDKGKITMMTLHAAKGLEFPVVFIVGVEEGILPHARVFNSSQAELEEERRLMYVGMTRAREELYITYAMSRTQFGGFTHNDPSRFIGDIDGAAEVSEDSVMSGGDNQDFYSDEPFDVGDKVRSAAFGAGKITEVDGMAVTIEFDSGQVKKLNAEYARLEKV